MFSKINGDDDDEVLLDSVKVSTMISRYIPSCPSHALVLDIMACTKAVLLTYSGLYAALLFLVCI